MGCSSIPIGVRKKFLKHLAKWTFPDSMYEGHYPTTSNLDNFIVGCKPICLSGEVPPRYERTEESQNAGVDRAGTACGVTDVETIVKSRTSRPQGFKKSVLAGCSVQGMGCSPTLPDDAPHLGCSPFLWGAKSKNCRFSDFIEELGSEISSKFTVDQKTRK